MLECVNIIHIIISLNIPNAGAVEKISAYVLHKESNTIGENE